MFRLRWKGDGSSRDTRERTGNDGREKRDREIPR